MLKSKLPYTEEHTMFRDAFRKFIEKEITPHHEQWEKDGVVPRELWLKAGENGFLCPWAEEKYGGIEADFLYSVIMIEELTKAGASGFGLPLHNDIVVQYINAFANDEQKQRWLPGCVSGEKISALAMTEPNAGSDVQSIKATVDFFRDGRRSPLVDDKTMVFDTYPLKDLIAHAQAVGAHKPVCLHAPRSDAYGDVKALTKAILDTMEQRA